MKLNRILAVVLAALLLMTMGAGALAERTMTVQGVGSVRVDSDRAGISLGVREVAEEVIQAQTQVNAKVGAIVESLKAMGLGDEDISTNGIGIYPNYNYDEGESIINYTAYNTIYVTVKDVNNTGAYIDAAFAAGANSLDYVDFSAADTDAAAAQALTLAVQSATEKARVLADASGVKLGAILSITDSTEGGYDGGALYARNDYDVAEEAAGTSIMAARQTVSATVKITYALEDE